MRRSALAAVVIGLCGAEPAWADQDFDARKLEQVVPAFIPRHFSMDLLLYGPTTWQAKVQWEITLLQDRISGFVLIFEAGGGYGFHLPTTAGPACDIPMTFLYQHSLQFGAAYRAQRPEGLFWGFQVGFGPLFYGARFQGLPTENIVIGTVEGRGQIGWRLGRVSYGFTLGYAQPTEQPVHSNAAPYIGGYTIGVFADWR